MFASSLKGPNVPGPSGRQVPLVALEQSSLLLHRREELFLSLADRLRLRPALRLLLLPEREDRTLHPRIPGVQGPDLEARLLLHVVQDGTGHQPLGLLQMPIL